jgi:hypothetical protein
MDLPNLLAHGMTPCFPRHALGGIAQTPKRLMGMIQPYLGPQVANHLRRDKGYVNWEIAGLVAKGALERGPNAARSSTIGCRARFSRDLPDGCAATRGGAG